MNIRSWLDRHRWNWRWRLKHWRRAWRYAMNRSTYNDGWDLFHDAEHITGYYALEGLSREDVLNTARERYGDVTGMEELAQRACERVASNWDSTGDMTGAAEDWAFDLIAQYAVADGVNLTDSWSTEVA